MAYTLTVKFKDGTHTRTAHDSDLLALEALAPIVEAREKDILHVDVNPYGMVIEPGSIVEIMERGEWIGPFAVTNQSGRTPDHVVLHRSGTTVFEHYADPYNTRLVTAPATV